MGEPKRIANHEMDFADWTKRSLKTRTPAKFNRLAAVGRHHNGIILVVFVKLGTEAFSVISMRPASRKERRLIDG
jgi:uncharacterized protein